MTTFSFLRPLDQPIGRRRLLRDMMAALQNNSFTNFWFVVAYAKSGPIYRLQGLLEKLRSSGKTSAAIVGIDQRGTSKEALELLLALFDSVYVTQDSRITFHPKIYLFRGADQAEAFVGSNNLTVGGTEKNFEAGVHLRFDLPKDADDLVMLESAWSELLPTACPATVQLDPNILTRLVADNVVVEEKAMHIAAGDGDRAHVDHGKTTGLLVKPESPLPKNTFATTQRTTALMSAEAASVYSPSAPVRGHAIQIKPHRNGEILLSYTAVRQNPDFFGWPFSGRTTPKKSSNTSYPQRVPDPVVNIEVRGADSSPVLTLSRYSLNTVYYEKKHEIRITASPLVGVVPDYSVMIMEESAEPGISYEITIHRPDSPDYELWVEACNLPMPSGGDRPRKYGWF